MSEFVKELCRSKTVSNAINKIDKDQADARLLIETIRSEFKDWQPPKHLVEVPKFVADFIEDEKGELKLYGAFHEIDESYGAGTELYDWVFENEDRQESFAKAWIDGYAVKKEQLYEVVFAENEDGDRYLLLESDGFFIDLESMNDGYYKQQFTEAEIKDIDERYWAFAVKVDEVEP